jgi:hypothetical protein
MVGFESKCSCDHFSNQIQGLSNGVVFLPHFGSMMYQIVE